MILFTFAISCNIKLTFELTNVNTDRSRNFENACNVHVDYGKLIYANECSPLITFAFTKK
jgi:hypothetical protein